MSDLIRKINGEVSTSRYDRQVVAEGRKMFQEVQLTGLELDGEKAVTMKVMDDVAEVDQHRQQRSGNSGVVDEILLWVELDYAQNVRNIRNGHHKNGFGI